MNKMIKLITVKAGEFTGGTEVIEPIEHLLNVQITKIAGIDGMAVTFLPKKSMASYWVFTQFITVIHEPCICGRKESKDCLNECFKLREATTKIILDI